jgi:hypothetical protein
MKLHNTISLKEILFFAKGKMLFVLYHVHAKLSPTCGNVLYKEDDCALCHKRLGHMNEKEWQCYCIKNVEMCER